MIKARIYITPKSDILDPQGKAILQALLALGFSDVAEVRVGKYMEILLHSTPATSATSATPGRSAAETVNALCEKLLANTVIETYRYDIEEMP